MTTLCLDMGYDFPEVHQLLEDLWLYHPYSFKREQRYKRILRYRTRRWVVERTHSCMNRFGRLLIRWKKKVENYIAMLHFTCAWITYRREGLFG
jgi:putative transposase